MRATTARAPSPRGRGARSAAAVPSTCAFTSCGCDHANGVTKQMRRPTRCKLQVVTWLHRRGDDQGEGERAVPGRRACACYRRRRQRVRAAGGRGDRAVPVWALGEQAVLRQVAPAPRLRRRRHGAARYPVARLRRARRSPGCNSTASPWSDRGRHELDVVQRREHPRPRRGRSCSGEPLKDRKQQPPYDRDDPTGRGDLPRLAAPVVPQRTRRQEECEQRGRAR